MDTNEGERATPEPEPIVIGLTGGIGSGKTSIARILENKGYPVYYSDARAKSIVNENPELKNKITELLGEAAYDENNMYNRHFVGKLVFEDKNLLEKLNQIIHPAVREDFCSWLKQQNKEFIFKETALLFELKLNEMCDKSLLVTADDKIRIKRVMDRDNKTYREVESIMDKQMPEKDKVKKADYIIYNNGNIDELHAEVDWFLEEMKKDLHR